MLSEGSIVAICTCVATVATLYFQNKKNAEKLEAKADKNADASKARAEDLKVAVDGKISTLIDKVEAEGALKTEVAALKATAAEKEAGKSAATTLAALQHDAIAAARALPPNDKKIVNGGKEQPCEDKS